MTDQLLQRGGDMESMAKAVNKQIGKVYRELVELTPKDGSDFAHRVIVTVQYCRAVASLEYRHRVWPYNLLDFSRRSGELWEDICRLAWQNALSPHFERMLSPPAFPDVRTDMLEKLRQLIGGSENADEVLAIVDGFTERMDAISMKADQTFLVDQVPHVVDFKLSFNSNEKGNKNRISDTAWAYSQWDPRSVMTLVVCIPRNNGYLETLERVGAWRVVVGLAAYDTIKQMTGFPLLELLSDVVDFRNDLSRDFVEYLDTHPSRLSEYLAWLPE